MIIKFVGLVFIGIWSFATALAQKGERIYENPSKKGLIESVNFVHSLRSDSLTDIIRMDHVGTGSGSFLPLVICEKMTRKSRPMEYSLAKVGRAELKRIENWIKDWDTSVRKQSSSDFGVFRLTFRIEKKIYQYYVLPLSESSKYFDRLQSQFSELKNKALDAAITDFRRSNGI